MEARAVYDGTGEAGLSCMARSGWEARVGFVEEASFDLGLGGRENLPKPLRDGERRVSQAETQQG